MAISMFEERSEMLVKKSIVKVLKYTKSYSRLFVNQSGPTHLKSILVDMFSAQAF